MQNTLFWSLKRVLVLEFVTQGCGFLPRLENEVLVKAELYKFDYNIEFRGEGDPKII